MLFKIITVLRLPSLVCDSFLNSSHCRNLKKDFKERNLFLGTNTKYYVTFPLCLHVDFWKYKGICATVSLNIFK